MTPLPAGPAEVEHRLDKSRHAEPPQVRTAQLELTVQHQAMELFMALPRFDGQIDSIELTAVH